MAGYIGSKIAVTQVDGYNRTEADAEFVQVTGDTMTGALNITASGSGSAGSLNINATDPFIRFYDSNGAIDARKWDIRAVGNSEGLVVRTVNDANTSFVTRLAVDPSGRVTKPYQPTGFWYLTGTQTIPSGSTEVVELNATGYSQGLSLNTSNRTITVPVAGKYLVCGAVTFLYGEAVHCGIQVNGGVSASAGVPNEWLQNGDYGTQAGDQESMQNVKILNLSANDTIRMRAYQQSGSTQQLQNSGRTFLSVTLLG